MRSVACLCKFSINDIHFKVLDDERVGFTLREIYLVVGLKDHIVACTLARVLRERTRGEKLIVNVILLILGKICLQKGV